MKLLVLLTLVGFCTCQAAVSAQNSKITLSATNTTLASVFRQIEQLTDYMFIYKSGDIAPFTDITIDRRQTEVNRILDECLSGTGLSYTFKDNLIIIQGATQQAEEKKVNGKITDRQGHPLPGVTVMIKGTQMGVVTDANGKYTIALPDAKDIFLRFTFIGMKPQEIAYTGQKEINVTLHEEATEMDEVVVTGYGSSKRSDLTGSVVSVKQEDLMQTPTSDVTQALAGRVAGVQVMQSEGEPGASVSIRVRGGISITQSNEPLYIIDGFPSEDGMNTLDPGEIESIDILKDASSTAIYGARGANGVIVITTKKGSKDGSKMQVRFDSFIGVKRIARKLPVLSTQEFILLDYERSLAFNGETGVKAFQSRYGSFAEIEENYGNREGIDWQEETLGRVTTSQNYRVNLSGGGKELKYNFSYSFF